MDAEPTKSLSAFGFLTILESAEHGFFGGYLVLSPLGRPLEFRCSTPIVASRAQEILYGPTLRPYLLAEVIGAALIESASLPVQAILTDLVDVLPLSELRPEPVFFVELRDVSLDNSVSVDLATTRQDEAAVFEGCRVRVATGHEEQLASSEGILGSLARSIELAEPFQRIRAALAEAAVATQTPEEPGDDLAVAA